MIREPVFNLHEIHCEPVITRELRKGPVKAKGMKALRRPLAETTDLAIDLDHWPFVSSHASWVALSLCMAPRWSSQYGQKIAGGQPNFDLHICAQGSLNSCVGLPKAQLKRSQKRSLIWRFAFARLSPTWCRITDMELRGTYWVSPCPYVPVVGLSWNLPVWQETKFRICTAVF